jgi:hypothetical protein
MVSGPNIVILEQSKKCQYCNELKHKFITSKKCYDCQIEMNKKYKSKVHTIDIPKKCEYCNELKTKFKTGKKCYDCDLKFAREYKEKNADKVSEKKKEWNKKNKDKIKIQRHDYVQRNKKNYAVYMAYRRREILSVQMREKYHFSINHILSKKSEKLSEKIKDIIIKWFEFNFSNEMNWDNHGDVWHIDHVLPVSKFDFNNQSDIETCFDWKNCIPLSKTENLKKNNKIKSWAIFLQEYKLQQFGKLNDCLEEVNDYIKTYTNYYNKMYSK